MGAAISTLFDVTTVRASLSGMMVQSVFNKLRAELLSLIGIDLLTTVSFLTFVNNISYSWISISPQKCTVYNLNVDSRSKSVMIIKEEWCIDIPVKSHSLSLRVSLRFQTSNHALRLTFNNPIFRNTEQRRNFLKSYTIAEYNNDTSANYDILPTFLSRCFYKTRSKPFVNK